MRNPRFVPLLVALLSAACLSCARSTDVQPDEPGSRGSPGTNLIEELRSNDPSRRVTAAESISALAVEGGLDSGIASELLPSLHDRNRFVRASVVSALGAFTPASKKIRVALYDRLLRDPSSAVRKLAAASLIELGENHSAILAADPQEIRKGELERSPFAALRPPVGWITIDPYRISSPQLECAKRSDISWDAGFLAGRLRIRRLLPAEADAPPFARQGGDTASASKVQPVEDGWLFAASSKNGGGSLSWYSFDGKQRRALETGRFTGFLKTSRALLAFRAAPYPASRQGEILSLTRAGQGAWLADPLASVELPIVDALEAPSGEIVFLTSDTLERWGPDGELRRVHSGSWGELDPHSLTLGPDGILYVGMKHAVARLVPTESGYFEQWLVPIECPVNTRNGVCGCFGSEDEKSDHLSD